MATRSQKPAAKKRRDVLRTARAAALLAPNSVWIEGRDIYINGEHLGSVMQGQAAKLLALVIDQQVRARQQQRKRRQQDSLLTLAGGRLTPAQAQSFINYVLEQSELSG